MIPGFHFESAEPDERQTSRKRERRILLAISKARIEQGYILEFMEQSFSIGMQSAFRQLSKLYCRTELTC